MTANIDESEPEKIEDRGSPQIPTDHKSPLYEMDMNSNTDPIMCDKMTSLSVDGFDDTDEVSTFLSTASESFDSHSMCSDSELEHLTVRKRGHSTPPAPQNNTFTLYNIDISHLKKTNQFIICAGSLFLFTITYSYLQELIVVHILDRKLPLFLATIQFGGYSFWSFLLLMNGSFKRANSCQPGEEKKIKKSKTKPLSIPLFMYVCLSILRAMDFGLTNFSMQYLNYPAKTLIKSSRVVFTMILGVFITRNKYTYVDYLIVMFLVCGLGVFLHADSNSNAVFNSIGVVILCGALVCDGTVNNWTERLMNQYSVGQDEFLFRLYSTSLIAMTLAAHAKGELKEGLIFLASPGKMSEIENEEPSTWSSPWKISVFLVFSMMGLLGSSSAAAITKNFGALAMSITSTTRKATTIFLSFLLFENNKCTLEHALGMIMFTTALITKSIRASKKAKHVHATLPKTQSHQQETNCCPNTSEDDLPSQEMSLLQLTKQRPIGARMRKNSSLSVSSTRSLESLEIAIHTT